MKNRSSNPALWLIVTVLGLGLALPAGAAPEKAKKPETPAASAQPTHDEMMEAMMKVGTPGPEHEKFKSWVGNFKAVTKSWMGPGEPQVSEGTCTNTLVLGGRFVHTEFKGLFMDKPFEGFGLTGYDRATKEYVGMWVDNFGTGIMTSRGTMDASGKVLTQTATYPDPMSGKPMTSKMVTRIVDDNQHVWEMYSTHEGKEVKEMEVTYTRM